MRREAGGRGHEMISLVATSPSPQIPRSSVSANVTLSSFPRSSLRTQVAFRNLQSRASSRPLFRLLCSENNHGDELFDVRPISLSFFFFAATNNGEVQMASCITGVLSASIKHTMGQWGRMVDIRSLFLHLARTFELWRTLNRFQYPSRA